MEALGCDVAAADEGTTEVAWRLSIRPAADKAGVEVEFALMVPAEDKQADPVQHRVAMVRVGAEDWNRLVATVDVALGFAKGEAGVAEAPVG